MVVPRRLAHVEAAVEAMSDVTIRLRGAARRLSPLVGLCLGIWLGAVAAYAQDPPMIRPEWRPLSVVSINVVLSLKPNASPASGTPRTHAPLTPVEPAASQR